MKNERGLSTIVTTLIIVLLVLVAIAIVWGVVLPLFQEGGDETEKHGNYLLYNCEGAEIGGVLLNDSINCLNGGPFVTKDSTICCADGWEWKTCEEQDARECLDCAGAKIPAGDTEHCCPNKHDCNIF